VADPRLNPARAVFYYDLASPEAYLAAERVNAVLPVVPEWEPIIVARLPGGETLDAWRCETERDSVMEDVARRAAARGVQPVRWPHRWPTDSELPALAATYAKGIGRAVAFSLAAFRQAFAAGRDLGDPDTVCIAAAACEVHPAALLKGVELRGTREALDRAQQRAAAAGVRSVPAVQVGAELFEGEAAVEAAAGALAPA
jgi:2-hydroxychromene-2-carboxylate isomerase